MRWAELRITLSHHLHVIRKNHFEVPVLWPVEFWQNIASRFGRIRIRPNGFHLVDPISWHHNITWRERRIHRTADPAKVDRIKLKMAASHLGLQSTFDHPLPRHKHIHTLTLRSA